MKKWNPWSWSVFNTIYKSGSQFLRKYFLNYLQSELFDTRLRETLKLIFLHFNRHFMSFGGVFCDFCQELRAFYRRFHEMSIKMLVIQLIQLISEHIGITLKNSASFQELIFFFSFQLHMFWTWGSQRTTKCQLEPFLDEKICTVE